MNWGSNRSCDFQELFCFLKKPMKAAVIFLACDLPIYMEPNDVGTIKFPSDRDSGGMYSRVANVVADHDDLLTQ